MITAKTNFGTHSTESQEVELNQSKLQDIVSGLDVRISNISDYAAMIGSSLNKLESSNLVESESKDLSSSIYSSDIIGKLFERLDRLYTIENRLYDLQEKTRRTIG